MPHLRLVLQSISLITVAFQLISAQNFQWSSSSDDSKPWPFGSGSPQFGASQKQQPQFQSQGQSQNQNQNPQLQVQIQPQQGQGQGQAQIPYIGQGQVQVNPQQQPQFQFQGPPQQQQSQLQGQGQPMQSRQPWQIIPDQGRPGNNQGGPGSGGGPINGPGQQVFILSPNQAGSVSGSVQNPVWTQSSGQNNMQGQLLVPVQVQQGQLLQPAGSVPGQQQGNGQFIVISSGSGSPVPGQGQVWAAAGANQPPNQPQWFGDPNRPPDAQVQPSGVSMHTSADKTVMVPSGSLWNLAWNNNNNPQQQPPAGWSNQQWGPQQQQQQGPVWQQPGQPAGAVNPNQPMQTSWQQQGWNYWQGQQQQQQAGGPPPMWMPGQQGWITNPPPVVPTTIPPVFSSTTPAIDDNTDEILRDLVSYHVGGAFPRDEVRQYNAKVPMPRQHRDYWLGDLYYNLDPASQLPGKLKCSYALPASMNRLHYDDGNSIGVVVFQCVQFQEKCCNLDCCNLYSKTPPPQQFRYPWTRGGAFANCLNWTVLISLLILSYFRLLILW